MSVHEQRAAELFNSGYNCAQAVLAAFCDKTGMSEAEALRLASSFGGGIGGTHENVCGALSGAFMVMGLQKGYTDTKDPQAKKEHYARIQELAKAFVERHGSMQCPDLLQNSAKVPKNPKLASGRPCTAFVADAAQILDEMLEKDRAKA